ncbi:DMT family transporter [Actinopolymorpha singaporensis]|uniref:Permease of the drug/metabolite transporter (DMT) superfamily n=1 Tax=Actinopolymorpha singaporensis TaxID=117157 RepID=A0A1H1S0M3_9ACTN|nr:DMT family transporter [Actinopolymorpha singaporensis]SDS41378.1 Permease of the drug/metabolite transporter (DMT) superfamily [Actinopolymorpha singaporensis]
MSTTETPDVPSASSASRPSGWLPALAAATTVLLWASAFVAIRHVGAHLSPGALSLGRLLVGSVVLGVVMLARPSPRPAPSMWPRLVVCGVLWFGVYNVALNAAERRVDAGTAAMVVNVGPILIALLAGPFLGERFPAALLLGSAVAFAGVVVIGVATSSGSGADTAGVVLCLVAAVAYAVGVVAQKPLLARLPALQVTWLACVIGTVACLPFGPELVREAAAARPSTLGCVVFLGAFPTAIAFTTWAYALSRTSAGRMGATTYLVPPVAILLGWLLLGEAPASLAFAGGALTLVGVALTRRGTTKRARQAGVAVSTGSVSSADSAAVSSPYDRR